MLFINLDCFMSCLVLEISAVEISAFLSNIMGLNGARLAVLKAPKNTFEKQILFPEIMILLLKITTHLVVSSFM